MRVAIVGAGVMGKSIAQLLLASAGVEEIHLLTRDVVQRDSILSELHRSLKVAIRQNYFDKCFDVSAALTKIIITDSYRSIKNCPVILEAVAEDYDIKKNVLRIISENAESNALVATNTSSLSITELSNCIDNPSRFLGIHFFNPATMMKLAEIVLGFNTAEETKNKAIDFAKLCGKTPVLANESPGFIVNRLLMPMINEAVGMLAEGVASAADIDKAMKLGANHPLGPLALSDFIGNDIVLTIMETLFKETGDPKYRPHSLLRKMVRANYLGKKSGKGFFKAGSHS